MLIEINFIFFLRIDFKQKKIKNVNVSKSIDFLLTYYQCFHEQIIHLEKDFSINQILYLN